MQHYVDIVITLALKDFKVRYRNSILGFLWSLLNPLAYMVILTLVFSFLLRVSVPNFAAWVLIGLLIWRFFSLGTSQGLSSIISSPSLVTKVYMPRYLIVLSNNFANLLGCCLEFAVFLPLLLALGVVPSIYFFFLPAIIILEFMIIFALSLWLAPLNVKYRDFYQLWDIALQLGFFLSPIVYDAGLIPTRFQFLYSLNPVTRLIESARDILLSQKTPALYDLIVISASIAIFLMIGFAIFRRLEQHLAEDL
jgi:lipopolysaccharide transport system permease protein